MLDVLDFVKPVPYATYYRESEAADYFGVEIKTIRRVLGRHWDEFESDGAKVVVHFKTKRKQYYLTRRAMKRLAMFLKSPVARNVMDAFIQIATR
ncbi:hypothetical protein GCM10025857_31840 [Alicyclobacillus contaminans]|uniref:hypothetical protein n=1 Tax=Alicyclobacillus contaminans TaxID=392016 RepID=UPI0004172373|nr:hypothetical protein [Alicyclobacillus contaminans]GMA51827.1 hypothetical protein GCM10025857_31840 [Alicyclobacillus contaminans]